jgi:hypothetical protein
MGSCLPWETIARKVFLKAPERAEKEARDPASTLGLGPEVDGATAC